jgi:hypothetical protein
MFAGPAISLQFHGEFGFPHFPEIIVSTHCLPSQLRAMSEGEAPPSARE